MIGVETHGSVGALAREWDQLADRTNAAPFLRPGWAAAWSSAFATDPLEILAARRDGRLVALVPLVRRRGALESATNWHTPEFGILAEDAAALEALTTALFAHSNRRVALSFLNPARGEVDVLVACAHRRRHLLRVRTLERPPYIEINGDWAAYEATLATKVRSDLRRRRRLLEKEGLVSLAIETGGAHLDDLLDEGFRIEGSGWKDEAGTAIVSQPQTRQFYTKLAHWAAERGWLRLAFLRLDGRPLAFEYGIEHARVYYLLKGGYDPRYARFSPGRLLIRDLLKHSFATGLERFDFGGVAEPFKLEWANGNRELVQVEAFPRSAPGFVSWAASPLFAYGPPAARRLLALVKR